MTGHHEHQQVFLKFNMKQYRQEPIQSGLIEMMIPMPDLGRITQKMLLILGQNCLFVLKIGTNISKIHFSQDLGNRKAAQIYF